MWSRVGWLPDAWLLHGTPAFKLQFWVSRERITNAEEELIACTPVGVALCVSVGSLGRRELVWIQRTLPCRNTPVVHTLRRFSTTIAELSSALTGDVLTC